MFLVCGLWLIALGLYFMFLRPALLPDLHTYYAPIHARDIEHPQFAWTFQRYLYDCMHDYLVEMFVQTPQNREQRP